MLVPNYVGGTFSATFIDLTVTGNFSFGNASTDVLTVNGQQYLPDNIQFTLGNSAAAPDVKICWNTTQTVDALFFGLATAQNTMIIAEAGDIAYDFAHAAQTNPTLYIQSAAQSATEFAKLNAGDLSFGLGIAVVATDYSIGRDADATNQLHLNVPTGAGLEYSINDVAKMTIDSTGLVYFVTGTKIPNNTYSLAVNNAGTGTVNLLKATTADEIDVGAVMNVGQINLPADGGALVIADMVVSATPAAATEESMAWAIDGYNMYKMYAEADHAGGIQNIQHHFAGTTGIAKKWYYAATALADDGTVNLPDATSGIVRVSCNDEWIEAIVKADGSVILTPNVSANVDDADTDTKLCVYDGGTYAIVKNRLGATGNIIIEYLFH